MRKKKASLPSVLTAYLKRITELLNLYNLEETLATVCINYRSVLVSSFHLAVDFFFTSKEGNRGKPVYLMYFLCRWYVIAISIFTFQSQILGAYLTSII